MMKIQFEENDGAPVEPEVLDAVPVLNAEAANSIDREAERERQHLEQQKQGLEQEIEYRKRRLEQEIEQKKRRLEQEIEQLPQRMQHKQEAQESAFKKLQPALNTVAPYRGEKTIVDFDIEPFRPRGSDYDKYRIWATFTGYDNSDWSAKARRQFKSYGWPEDANGVLNRSVAILERTQDKRLEDYLSRCKVLGRVPVNDALYSDSPYRCLVDDNVFKILLEEQSIDAFAVRIHGKIYPVLRDELEEYLSLRDAVAELYKKQSKRANNLRQIVGLASLSPLLFAFVVVLVYALIQSPMSLVAFISVPAVYASFAALLAVLVIAVTVLYVKANQCSASDKEKYPLPKSVSIWQQNKAKEKALTDQREESGQNHIELLSRH